MLIVEIDVIHSQALERRVATRVHILRAAIESAPTAIFTAVNAEFGCNDYAVATSFERLPEQHFIRKRTINV